MFANLFSGQRSIRYLTGLNLGRRNKVAKTAILHDINATRDEKFSKLLLKFGYEGSGFFWAIVESLYINEKPIDMDTIRFCALSGKMSDKKVKDMVNFMVEIGLLYTTVDGLYSSKRVERDLGALQKKQESYTNNINKRWKKNTIVSKTDEQTEYNSNTIVSENKVEDAYNGNTIEASYSCSYSRESQDKSFDSLIPPIIPPKTTNDTTVCKTGWFFDQANIYAPSIKSSKSTAGLRPLLEANLLKQYSQDQIIEGLKKAEQSSFLKGSTGWVADQAWFLEGDNFAKVLEGRYDDRKPTASKKSKKRGESDHYDEFVVQAYSNIQPGQEVTA